jgi:DNA-binding transcriptional MerR regulator
LTPGEVAQTFDVTERTLEYWRYSGRGPAFVRVGKRVRYRPADLEAYLQANRQGGDASQ